MGLSVPDIDLIGAAHCAWPPMRVTQGQVKRAHDRRVIGTKYGVYH